MCVCVCVCVVQAVISVNVSTIDLVRRVWIATTDRIIVLSTTDMSASFPKVTCRVCV